ncbi:MAG: MopE-related protein [Myxococcota bacterium]
MAWRSAFVLVVVLGGCGDDGSTSIDGAVDATSDRTADADAAAMCGSNADCDNGSFCDGPESCDPGNAAADARGCVAGDGDPCMTGQMCNETDDRCDTICAVTEDADNDGRRAIECGGNDCDDADPNRFPGNPEVCDSEGHDEDCDPATFGDRDLDGDLAIDARCCNDAVCGNDCNDLRPDVGPTATEICDLYDNDCDANIDEAVTVMLYPDADFDGRGDMTAAPMMGCLGDLGFAQNDFDCDDTNALIYGGPAGGEGAPELCDTVDNDCDTTVDETPSAVPWYVDSDGDLYGDFSEPFIESCLVIVGRVTRGLDCDDSNSAIRPGAPDNTCDGIDDDCDGLTDEDMLAGGSDVDGDGVPSAGCGGMDCDDFNPDRFPGAPEVCDFQDNDCDTSIDEAMTSITWYEDADGDSYGDPLKATMVSCERPPGFVARAGDCDDSDPASSPGASELCDGVDQDCDAQIDETRARQGFFPDMDGDEFGTGMPVFSCQPPMTGRWATQISDCDDSNTGIRNGVIHYADTDMDMFGDPNVPEVRCIGDAAGFVLDDQDCDDTTDEVSPVAPELCNSRNDDCDTMTDEGASAFCALPNATAACTMGSCDVAMCDAGFDNCDGMSATGCNLSTVADPMNCGGCGVLCDSMTESCINSACQGVAEIAIGARYNGCIRTTRGDVRCWGANGAGQLGDGTFSPSLSAVTVINAATLLPLANIVDVELQKSSVSTPFEDGAACAIQMGGNLFCWGTGDEAMTTSPVDQPRAFQVTGVSNVTDVAIGLRHTAVINSLGEVWSWGDNASGQLGRGDAIDSATPVRMEADDDGAGPMAPSAITDALEVHAGGNFTCVLRSGPVPLSCVGTNNNLELGVPGGGTSQVAVPTAVSLPAGVTISKLTVGLFHACILRSDGQVDCWGNNRSNEAGATSGNSRLPGAISGPPPNINDVWAGMQSTCVRYMNPMTGATLACWGSRRRGQRADGTTGTSSSAAWNDAMLEGGGTFDGGLALEPYFEGWCAQVGNAEVTCWGSNLLGIFGVSPTMVPVRSRVDPTATVSLFP